MSDVYKPSVSYTKAKKSVRDALTNAVTAIFGQDAEDDNGRWAGLVDQFTGELRDKLEDGESATKARKALHDDFKSQLAEMILEEIETAVDALEFD